jgi:hypothetical protein
MLLNRQNCPLKRRHGVRTTVPTRYLPNSAKGLQDT